MRISLNWLKQYVNLDQIPTTELIDLIGSRLVEVEEVIDNTHKFDGIYVVKVVECVKVEGSDHLSLTKIDDNGAISDITRDENGLISVVCGAPNVHADMFAVWIAPDAIVPATYNTDEPFQISTRDLRGITSHGMLGALDELGLGEDHGGIVELLEPNLKPGTPFATAYPLIADVIIDIENKSLTHRPDCFGIIGFAREVAGILDQHFSTPDWLIKSQDVTASGEVHDVKISITDPKICGRYEGIVFTLNEPTPAPATIGLRPTDIYLLSADMRPIDDMVDLTNYLMLLTGQPLHAFDYDKLLAVGGQSTLNISVRVAKPDEQITLLDQKTITLDENDIIITSNDVPVALAGAMGGANTVVDASTKRIFLESASFSLYNLRRTQMKHGIFSEAITRFTKGQPLELTDFVLREFSRLSPNCYVASPIFDQYPEAQINQPIQISPTQINSLLGSTYPAETIIKALTNVGFGISSSEQEQQNLSITPPYWRTDIHLPEDIIEEAGRLLGYDNIPVAIPTRPMTSANYDLLLALKSKLRDQLSSLGANELITYGFVSSRLLQGAGQDPANSYEIVNSLSPSLEFIRQSLTPSLLDKAYLNIKSAYDHFILYEFNQTFDRSIGLNAEHIPIEKNHLAFVVADRKRTDSAYYEAKLYANAILDQLGIAHTFTPLTSEVPELFTATAKPFEPKRSAIIQTPDGVTIGVIGELRRAVQNHFKLPAYISACELNLDILLDLTTKANHAKTISMNQPIDRDLTVRVPADTPYATVAEAIISVSPVNTKLIPASIYQGDDGGIKHLSFHIRFFTGDVDDIINHITTNLQSNGWETV